VGGTGRVARPAADDQAAGGVAAACDFADVVGGEVGDCGLGADDMLEDLVSDLVGLGELVTTDDLKL
jgi:hypothetical protein